MNKPDQRLVIDGVGIGADEPTYFIADLAANHDGSLERAKDLIHKAKDAGANAAKFQHFKAEGIVSDFGFRALGHKQSHQASWNKSVFEVYKDASVSTDWTSELKKTCDEVGITFFTSPYDKDLVDHIDPYVPAYKIGSGDITWTEIIRYIASKNKPYFLATGASSFEDVDRAVQAGLSINSSIALLQCNTNYTGSLENMRHIKLNVLRTYRAMYPTMVLGLSDHTPGHSTVLGAVALGARIVEKHFTDDRSRNGPDHLFSMDPRDWAEMVDRTRELEAAMGNGVKKVEENEEKTVILQRRSLRFTKAKKAGEEITGEDLVPLRPCPADGLAPYHLQDLIGCKMRIDRESGDYIRLSDLD
ncbi:N-acetylneuraminate synthase [Polynucleobacter paneuropaeus]|nr:N-acetylneuraminate synthase [Polynucleobacter paneuropaeus]MBT8533710.1 N-acetylneuraminate synthase [Polynucleobacter paneuropaeus]